jgi:hypothetical protein
VTFAEYTRHIDWSLTAGRQADTPHSAPGSINHAGARRRPEFGPVDVGESLQGRLDALDGPLNGGGSRPVIDAIWMIRPRSLRSAGRKVLLTARPAKTLTSNSC